MKRDMDLIRQILFAVESAPDFKQIDSSELKIPAYSPDQIAYHAEQLVAAGFLDGLAMSLGSQDAPVVAISKLTWQGHEFIDAARSDTVWKAARERGKKVAGSLTIATMKALLAAEAARLLGLG